MSVEVRVALQAGAAGEKQRNPRLVVGILRHCWYGPMHETARTVEMLAECRLMRRVFCRT